MVDVFVSQTDCMISVDQFVSCMVYLSDYGRILAATVFLQATGGGVLEVLTICLVAVSLAMDAFAVSISNGASVSDFCIKDAVQQGLFFGLFQFLMPLLGWFLGNGIYGYLEQIDHWVAFGLLAVIGGNMIYSSLSTKKEERCTKWTTKILLLQAVATSIDALAVGIGFAILQVNIYIACAIIGVVALVLSVLGGILGRKLGGLLQTKAEWIGGLILIGIGCKILLEHTVFAA